MRKYFCWLFGHKFITDIEFTYVRTGHCSKCKKKMLGAYMKGEYTGNMFWVYIVGDLKDKVSDSEKQLGPDG